MFATCGGEVPSEMALRVEKTSTKTGTKNPFVKY